jgi:3-oxoacyl-[acyl-carrier protein] reductase
MQDMKGKVVFITGGSKGIGRHTAYRFGKAGAKVIINARGLEALERTASEFRADGIDIDYYRCDVSVEDNVKSTVSEIIEKDGRIDVLINNAGVGLNKPVEEVTAEEYDLTMDVNMRGVFLMTKYIVPHMKKRKQGFIINVSSGEGVTASENASIYGASKFAVRGFTEAVATELRPYNIRVSIIYPGAVNTDFLEGIDDEKRKKIIQPEDIAESLYHMAAQPERYWIYELYNKAFYK